MQSTADTKGSKEELTKLWTKQLYLEYERLCYSYRIRLEPVVITIADFASRWGEWNPSTRTISLAYRLVSGHGWDIVLEVLKHEMAHQIVGEVFRSQEAHGELFKKACTMLGMSEWAKASALPLHDKILVGQPADLSEKEQGLLRKAKKLLALAASSNEHEAFLAMKKVQELYELYHWEYILALEKPSYVCAVINHKKKRFDAYQAKIAALLVRHFHVQVIYASLFDAATCHEHKVMELLGAPQQVEMAEYVYWFLYNNLQRLWCEEKAGGGRGHLSRRNHFLQGVVSGFDEKLQKARKEKQNTLSKEESKVAPTAGPAALVKKEEQRLASFVAYRHPRLRTTYTSRPNRDLDAYQAGQRKGRELVLHRGLTGQAGNQGRLLE